jgi:hypothetical protein
MDCSLIKGRQVAIGSGGVEAGNCWWNVKALQFIPSAVGTSTIRRKIVRTCQV